MGINGANIQTENGNWSKLHNQILEALMTAPLSGTEFRCLMYLFRNTYGWKRKEHTFSMQELAHALNIDKRPAIRAMQDLLGKKVVYRVDNGKNKPATWGFNKYVERWEVGASSDKSVTTSNDKSVTTQVPTSDKSDTTSSDKSVTTVVTKVTLDTTCPKDIKDIDKEGRENPLPPLASVGQRKPHKKTLIYHDEWKREYAPLFERLIDVYRIRPLIDDVQDDKAISALQRITIDLAKMKVDTVEAVEGIERQWYATDFRGKKGEAPKGRQFLEFAANQKSNVAAINNYDSPRKRMKVLA